MKTKHKRGQFTFYASYFDAIDRIPKSRRMEAFYTLILYALDGVEPEGLSEWVDGVFEALRPNIDNGRAKAEKMTGARAGKDAGAAIGSPQEDKEKNKNKNKSESEKERKTETKTEIKSEAKAETEPAPAEARGAGASEAGARGTDGLPPAGESGLLSLPDREKKDLVFPEAGAEQGETPPEQREPYAEMFRSDPILASAWRELLDREPGIRPANAAERERLLSRLRAAPAWERLAIVNDRLGSPLSRDWQRLRSACLRNGGTA